MKKLFAFFVLILIAAGFVSAQARAGATMYVSVKSAALKSGTGLFAGTNGTLEYGERVTVIQVSGNSAEVRSAANPSLTGWTAAANLTTRQIVAGASGNVSASETAMAGKGFNQEVESIFKNQNSELNFDAVDRVERITVNDADLLRFMQEGKLIILEN